MGEIHDLSPNGVNSIGWIAEVNTFADLPAVADNTGKTYMVLTSTGLMITFNLKRSGLYYSDGVTWTKKSDVQSMFADDALTFQDDIDKTKQIGFQLSSIGTGIRRIFTWPNKNGTVAMLSDITGTSWTPPPIGIGDLFFNGPTAVVAGEGGMYVLFNTDTEEAFLQVVLNHSGLTYDNSDLAIKLWCRTPTTPTADEKIAFIMNHQYSLLGTDTGVTLTASSPQETIVDGETADELFTITLPTMSALANAKVLRMGIEWDTEGLAPDAFGSLEVLALEIIKV